MSKLITATVEVGGYLRYAHYEGIVSDEEYKTYIEEVGEDFDEREMVKELCLLIIDDYRVDFINNIDDITITDVNDNIDTAESLLKEAHNFMDNVHGYDTELYKRISKYFENEN